jgi:hypothetical protein
MFLLQCAVLGLSAVGVAYTVVGLIAAYQALIAAKQANSWAYYTYELGLMTARMQFSQTCTGIVPVCFFSFTCSD